MSDNKDLVFNAEETKTLDLVWNAVKKQANAQELFSDVIAVPCISQAKYFGMTSVMTKPKTGVMNKLTNKPTYHVLGHLYDLLQLDISNVELIEIATEPKVEESLKNTSWEACDLALGDKMATVSMQGLTKVIAPFTLSEGDMYVRMDIPELANAKNIYIVTEVLKFSRMSVSVSGDDDCFFREKLEGGIPIGFRYTKFRLGADGCVCEQIKSNWKKMDAKWKVVVDQMTPYFTNFGNKSVD